MATTSVLPSCDTAFLLRTPPKLQAELIQDLYATLAVPAMPIQDAVDLARFLVETTIGFIRFAVFMPKSVGGAVGIAAITKHEGFRWVQRAELAS